jgi:diaminopropionate ammonia-lyase
MRLLADAPFGDTPIVAGESAVPGLTGLLLAAQDEDVRRQLRLDGESVVFLIGTEGATDPDLYESIVGRTPEQVLGSAQLASNARKVS